MRNKLQKPDTLKRGRPKTLDRDHVLQIALMSYWADGPTSVAISEICRKADISKPGLYREFGNDDGLKEAALDLYREMVLTKLYDILAREDTFEQGVEALITFTIQDRQLLGIPNGCLQVAMRANREDLGQSTREKVDLLRDETLKNYERWIERAKSRGEFKASISTKAAAHYCDAQNCSAMRMQREGVSNEIIGQSLRLAFSAII
ncbi:TetR/AcrR family transcriptional regulator [Alphaproteobacteria bacterium]|nr:TetR/AcrR family transcriptional regulator [Alphaproteobacteria bacterium]